MSSGIGLLLVASQATSVFKTIHCQYILYKYLSLILISASIIINS